MTTPADHELAKLQGRVETLESIRDADTAELQRQRALAGQARDRVDELKQVLRDVADLAAASADEPATAADTLREIARRAGAIR